MSIASATYTFRSFLFVHSTFAKFVNGRVVVLVVRVLVVRVRVVRVRVVVRVLVARVRVVHGRRFIVIVLVVFVRRFIECGDHE